MTDILCFYVKTVFKFQKTKNKQIKIDVFENFRNKCIEIYDLNAAHFLSAPGLAWQIIRHDKNISSYLMYLDANNLNGLAMSQKPSVNGFKWVKKLSKFDERSIKNYDENSNKGYSLEEYPKKLFSLYSDFKFLPEREKIEKCEKLVCNIKNKEKYVAHIRALKQALNHGLILKRVHSVIQFNQETWLKPYIDMNSKKKKKSKT